MRKHTFLLLIIFYFLSQEAIAQSFSLEVVGANDKETKFINELDYKRKNSDYNSILNEIDSLEHKIFKAGYIESKHSSAKKINDSLYQVKFQLKNKYEFISINYDSSVIDEKIINSVTKDYSKDYFVIPIFEVEETLKSINLKIANSGFPFTKTRLSEIRIKDKKTLTANLATTNADNKRGLDNIIIKGYEDFPKSFLDRFLKIKPTKTFNIQLIKEKMNALNNLRFAEQTKDPEILFTKDSTNLYIYLQKSKSNTFDGFLGFNTNEETNKIDFNGYLNLQLNNNLNYGESFSLIYKSNESEQKNFEANLNLPYLFSTPIGTELSLKILKVDSTFTTINQKATVFYQLNSKNRFFVGFENIESNDLLNQEAITSISDYKSNGYNFKYSFENRQNLNMLFQLKSNVNLEFGINNRKAASNNETQEKITLDAFHIFQLNKKNSFYTRVSGSILNSDSFFENELFRFGGINSIRGFQENSIVANQFIVLNTEYRYQLSSNIYTNSIIDFSNFDNKITNTKENLYGFGFGFGTITRAGLLKFNFANGKTENQNFKFSNSKIHISLVAIF